MIAANGFLKIDGRNAYVVTRKEWGQKSHYIVLADSLNDAKRSYGHTRERFVYLYVRRARQADAGLPVRES